MRLVFLESPVDSIWGSALLDCAGRWVHPTLRLTWTPHARMSKPEIRTEGKAGSPAPAQDGRRLQCIYETDCHSPGHVLPKAQCETRVHRNSAGLRRESSSTPFLVPSLPLVAGTARGYGKPKHTHCPITSEAAHRTAPESMQRPATKRARDDATSHGPRCRHAALLPPPIGANPRGNVRTGGARALYRPPLNLSPLPFFPDGRPGPAPWQRVDPRTDRDPPFCGVAPYSLASARLSHFSNDLRCRPGPESLFGGLAAGRGGEGLPRLRSTIAETGSRVLEMRRGALAIFLPVRTGIQ